MFYYTNTKISLRIKSKKMILCRSTNLQIKCEKFQILIAGIISIWMIFLNASIKPSWTKQVIEKLFIHYSLFICLDYYFDWIWYSIQWLYRDTPYIQAKQHKNMTIFLYHNGPYSWALNYIMSFIEIKRNHIFWRHLDRLFSDIVT